MIELIRQGEKLKKTNRAGWILSGVVSNRPESVAEHSYGSILTAITIAQHVKSDKMEINIEKVTIMAALHDLPESITGDIARTAEFEKDRALVRKKALDEQIAIKRIIEPMGDSFQNLLTIWIEFDKGESLESRVVKGADIIDMLVHARSLEDSGESPAKLDQFFKSSRTLIESLDIPIVTEIYNKLLQEHLQKAEERGIDL